MLSTRNEKFPTWNISQIIQSKYDTESFPKMTGNFPAFLQQLLLAICQLAGGVVTGVLWRHQTGPQAAARTMGRPGAAPVPAGSTGPDPSYSAIVILLGVGGHVSLTVILRGYFYRKHQSEGAEVTRPI